MNKSLVVIMLCLFATSAAAEEATQDFEGLELGYPPDELFIIDGNFEVVAHESGKVLRVPPDPIIECGLLFGKSSKGAMTAEAKVLASKRGRRSFPRFGLGVHGISGFRVRVVPAQKRIELVHQEEVIKTSAFPWKSGSWCRMKLRLSQNQDGRPKVQAWVWMEGQKEPEKANLDFEGEPGKSSQGKASIWGTPYSGKEILFDDLKVTWTPAPPKN